MKGKFYNDTTVCASTRGVLCSVHNECTIQYVHTTQRAAIPYFHIHCALCGMHRYWILCPALPQYEPKAQFTRLYIQIRRLLAKYNAPRPRRLIGYSHIKNDHLSLFAVSKHYLVVWVGGTCQTTERWLSKRRLPP